MMARRTEEESGETRPTSNRLQKFDTPRLLIGGMVVISVLLVVCIAVSILLTARNGSEFRGILEESVRHELIAACVSAREVVYDNLALFRELDSQGDVDRHRDEWNKVVAELRELRDEFGAEYIYALKERNGAYWFVFDTDEEADALNDIFTEYELAAVHERAFVGEPAAGLMNVDDEWGSYNTGAVPIYEGNKVIGVVSVDIADHYIVRATETSSSYTVALVLAMVAFGVLLFVVLILLVRSNNRVQGRLYHMANFDAITGLPNRAYLFGRLKEFGGQPALEKLGLAVFFIDLDNFKSVNDHAGHDAGDELLREISNFLEAYGNHAGPEAGFGLAAVGPVSLSGAKPAESITARIGGDEFLQIILGINSRQAAEDWAKRMIKGFAEHSGMQRFISDYSVGLSVGIALYPSMTTDFDELITCADIAMYYAKNRGKNNYHTYEPFMGNDVEGVELIVRKSKGNGSSAP
jgi:GGDEF domain-containing protein